MNGENNVEPVNILVSRDELLFVLNALEADFIPGLDSDPLGELTPEQQAVAQVVARRALQARELARMQPDGEVQIHTALLTMVGVCAYAHNVAFVYHWPANEDSPRRYFGHIRGDDIVAHSRPEEVLHLFSLLPSKEHLIDQILTFCRWRTVPDSPPIEFTLPAEAFASVRELAASGSEDQALQTLTQSGVSAAAADAFVNTLTHLPQVSILQTVKQPGTGRVEKRDITLLKTNTQSWLALAPPEDDAPLRVKTVTPEEVGRLLAEWL